MARTLECQEYKDWSREMNEFRVYGDEREIFTILEPFRPADCRSGAVEVRASYLVRVQRVRDAQAMARRAQEVVWPLLGFSGQHQQMLHGKASQSLFVWSSTWSSLSEWERATSEVGADEFRQWHRDWCEVADFGGPAEAFVNL